MSSIHSYELHILRGQDWIIDSVYDLRDDALRDAHSFVAGNPQACVQLVEERFDPGTGNTHETVLFRAQPPDKGTATFKQRTNASKRTQQAKSDFRLSPAMVTVLLAAAAFAAGVLVGMHVA